MCLQINIKLTLISYLTLLLLQNHSLNFRHKIILIQGKYRLLVHTLTVIMLLLLLYLLMMKVILTAEAHDQILRNRLNVMLHILILKLHVKTLELPVEVQNMLHLPVQSMSIIKQLLQLMYMWTSSDNDTLQSTNLVYIPLEVLHAPQEHHMITRPKAKKIHVSLVAHNSKDILREPNTMKEALKSLHWLTTMQEEINVLQH